MARRRTRKNTGPTIFTLKPLLRRILIELPDLVLSGDGLKTSSQRFELEIGKDTEVDEPSRQYNHLILSAINTTGQDESVIAGRTFMLEEFDGSPLVKHDDDFTGALGDLEKLSEACAAFIKTHKVEVKPPPADSNDRPRRRNDRSRSRRSGRPGGGRRRRPPRRRERSAPNDS